MIIVKIHGGLGNQLFQYAFGRKVAIQNACELKLDLSFFEDQSVRRYALNHYSVMEHIASPADCERLVAKHNSKLRHVARKYFRYHPHYIEENGLSYNQAYLEVKGECLFNGYWQSEKYFADISHIIRNEFKVTVKSSGPNIELRKKIDCSNAVSLHIRRGDFENNKIVNHIHGVCSLDYYLAGIQYIATQLADPVFYVFSDDILWAKENLTINYAVIFVDINDEYSAFEDMALMSRCKHHIIANSTFSWWGAWLNPDPCKIVVAPKNWFADPAMNLQSASIVPEKWVRL
ncbi:alpha-1,2-fucosyltransferase [Mucilaginibacter flavus]|uniref:alpha-1,2-fucosyltransferase n=1 Tax=Mucilaginibacter flavus TaxID=931504 RepID=UPI0025B56C82|nr:alpha-1,2-fucosyltransferase [Mucilaginibacter flavus]MDN3584404.1 alpha-1,2-fucosyltransferase [Mucilaginibacter flavus]